MAYRDSTMRVANIPKLFGHEDPFHIHKVLGASSLLHFVYRMCCAILSPDHTLGFDAYKPYTISLIILHMMLSGTSLVFTIPSNRVRKLPMIWPEFRLHSIIFAYRSLLAMLCFWLNATLDVTYFHYVRGLIVLGTLVCADTVTSYYKKHDMLLPGETTMRSMPFPENTPLIVIRITNMYYSISQVLATMNILFVRNMNRPFAVLFPIQLAAFLMTMVRKSILTSGEWHILYGGALALNYVYALYAVYECTISSTLYWLLSISFIISRFVFHVNKYVLWSGIVGLFMYTTHAFKI